MVRMATEQGEPTAAMLAEVADLPYFRVDAERNVVELSPAMERLTGFAAGDVLGRSCLRLHRCAECLQGCGVFDHHQVTDMRLELFAADGSTVTVRKSGRVFLDDDGRISGALEVVRPLSDCDQDEAPAASQARPGEANRIRRALETARYRRSDAARSLGMSRTTLWRKMREYGL
jgi:PAS domain S-box-containing protein